MVQQIIQKPQAYLKTTQIAPTLSMNDWHPVVGVRDVAQVDHPQIGKAGREHQTRDALGLAQVTLVHLKPSAFLVRKEGFNAHPLAIELTGRLDTRQIANQIDRFGVTLLPPSDDHDGP